LPVGKAALLMCQIDLLRDKCCEAASQLMKRKCVDELELEECARLDDGLAAANRILRSTLIDVTRSKLRRQNR